MSKNGEHMEENMRIVRSGAAALLILCALLSASASAAGEIIVMSTVAVKEAYLELVPAFERATENKVVTMWVGNGSIIERLKRGEIVDLAIVTAGGVDELNKLGWLASGVPMAKSGVGVAVRAGAPRPDISSGEALRRALLASKSIALSPGPSGVYLSSLFAKWAVTDELKPKIKQVTGLIGDAVARGDAEIGFQQVSELLPIKGITYLGPLSDDIQLITVFSGAVHNQAKNPAGASSLLKFLTSPDAAPAIRKSGMEPGITAAAP
jgi:molybdate transport system substrate-binding protein